MPAGLDFNENTGEAAALSVRKTMWHREGIVLDDHPSLDRALEQAGLDFQVEKREVYYRNPDEHPGSGDAYERAPGQYVTVRTDRNISLGSVGETYVPLQNEEGFGVLEPMIDSGLAVIETAGSLYQGRDVWMLVRFDEQKMLGKLDEEGEDGGQVASAEDLFGEVRPYGLLTNNHAGQRKVTLMETPIRVVCANTLGMALARKNDLTVEVVHASNVEQNVQKAADLLFGQLALRYGTIGQVRQLLRQTQLSQEAHQKLVLDPVVPVAHLEAKIRRGDASGHTRAALDRAGKKRQEIKTLWTSGEGHSGDHSAWEALNGLVQALDHFSSWEPRKDSSRVKSTLRGRIGKNKKRVGQRLSQYARASEEEREKILTN